MRSASGLCSLCTSRSTEGRCALIFNANSGEAGVNESTRRSAGLKVSCIHFAVLFVFTAEGTLLATIPVFFLRNIFIFRIKTEA